jgi:hypothetical protein
MKLDRFILAAAVFQALAPGLPSHAVAQDVDAFPGWNMAYTVPPGWYVRQAVGRVRVLASNSQRGAIFVAPGLYESVEDALASMRSFSRLANMSKSPTEGPIDTTLAGLPATLASFTARSQYGGLVSTRVAGLFTPHRTGIVILGVATPDDFPDIKKTVEAMAATVTVGPPDVDAEEVAALVGLWIRYRDGRPPSTDPEYDRERSVENTIEFEEGDRFVWKSSIYLAAEARGQQDDPTTTAGESDRGTYTVIGSVLVLKGELDQRVVAISLEGDRLDMEGAVYYRRR